VGTGLYNDIQQRTSWQANSSRPTTKSPHPLSSAVCRRHRTVLPTYLTKLTHKQQQFYCKKFHFTYIYDHFTYTPHVSAMVTTTKNTVKLTITETKLTYKKLLYLTILTMQKVSWPATCPILRKINPVQALLQDTLNFNIYHLHKSAQWPLSFRFSPLI
jgi:hypothetical protein